MKFAHYLSRSLIALLPSGAIAALAQAKEINVYSARHYETDKEINSLFTEKTGIKVNYVQIKEASQILERLAAEGSKSPADVFVSADVGNLWRAKSQGLTQPWNDPKLAQIVPENLRDKDGHWMALTLRSRVLVYRKDRVKPEQISTYEDLIKPEFKGRILVRSSSHVYNQSLVASFIAHLGLASTQKWVEGVKANLARKPEGGDTDQIKAVAAEVGDIAISNSYYFARLASSSKAEDQALIAKLGVLHPNQKDRGAHVNLSGVSLTKFAPNKESAKLYVQFLLSPEVQEKFAKGSLEYPVLKSVPLDPSLQALGTPKWDSLDLNEIGKYTPEAVQLMDKYGWR
jgi:iron(III) transport system substrate-binding protein